MNSEDERAVLEANREFYRALELRDFAQMKACWAQRDDAACTHPGWHRLDGWEEISRSWEAIFANSRPWKVSCEEVRLFLAGDLGVVLCTEVLEPAAGGPGSPARMQATNVLRRVEGKWKMVHHHASPMAEMEETAEPVN